MWVSSNEAKDPEPSYSARIRLLLDAYFSSLSEMSLPLPEKHVMASFVSQENAGPPQLLSLHPLITLGAISRLNSIRSQGVISKYEC